MVNSTIIIFLGPSGCGKGTQAELLASKLKIPHIETGQLLREAWENKTPEGILAHETWGQGIFSPTPLVFKILRQRLDQPDYRDGFILEGWPRQPDQMEILDTYLMGKDQQVTAVILLQTKVETSISRIKDRVEEGEGRSDDEKREAVRNRLAEYERTISPIIKYYEDKNVLKKVDNEGSIQEVFQLVLEVLNLDSNA